MNQPPPTGAYYRVIDPVDGMDAGALVLLWTDEGQIRGQHGDDGFCYSDEEFAKHFDLAPQGRTERLAELNHLLEQANNAEAEDRLALPAPAEEQPGAGALVTTEQRSAIVEAKRAALLAKKRVEALKTTVSGMLAEQQKSLELMAQQWGAKLAKLNYAIDSVNLYLGRDESVVCIQEGSAAPAGEPISIRQGVLFMDEETALLTEQGGIDFQSIGDFDEWLCEPSHLSQLLPEQKGIVAMRLRRGEKFYANASVWEKIMFSEANAGTYILVRNGERLWRVWNEFELPGEHLVPTRQEFDALFFSEWGDKEPLRPGTRDYQRAMDRATGVQRRYLQAVLILQGLLDRTQIFKPLPVERVNLMAPDPDASVVRMVRDAENILGTGRPPYRKWLEALNAKLEVGKRVVFGGTEYTSYRHEDRKERYSRTHPPFVGWPPRHVVYSITNKSSSCKFCFKFARDGVKAPATFHFYPSDLFVLNFDAADEADIEFYLGDRCNRHNYLDSFPLLKAG